MSAPNRIVLWVDGRPRPKGNHKALCPQCSFGRPGHPYVVEDWRSDAGKLLKSWCARIAATANAAAPGRPWRGAVAIHVVFVYVRPNSNRQAFPQNARFSDGDKLERAVWDALQTKGGQGGRVLVDDCQVVKWSGCKRWGEREGVQITVEALEPEQLALTDDAPVQARRRPPRKTSAPTKKRVDPSFF